MECGGIVRNSRRRSGLRATVVYLQKRPNDPACRGMSCALEEKETHKKKLKVKIAMMGMCGT